MPFFKEFTLKRKLLIMVPIAVAIAVLCVGIVAMISIYHAPIEITQTKLQMFTFKTYNEGVILCNSNQTITLDNCARKIFDENRFKDDIDKGDRLFIRVPTAELEGGTSSFSACAVLGATGEYLSLEKLNEQYISANSTATVYLLISLLIAVVLNALSVFFFIKFKKNK